MTISEYCILSLSLLHTLSLILSLIHIYSRYLSLFHTHTHTLFLSLFLIYSLSYTYSLLLSLSLTYEINFSFLLWFTLSFHSYSFPDSPSLCLLRTIFLSVLLWDSPTLSVSHTHHHPPTHTLLVHPKLRFVWDKFPPIMICFPLCNVCCLPYWWQSEMQRSAVPINLTPTNGPYFLPF